MTAGDPRGRPAQAQTVAGIAVAERRIMAAARLDGLQVDEDMAFQRWAWRAQRVGWALIVLLLVAAVLGLLGSGPLSEATASVPGVMRLEYQRFARYQTSHTLTIRLEPAAVVGPAARVGIDAQYLESVEIKSVLPPPRAVHGAGDRLIYEFDVAEPGRPLAVAFLLAPQQIGRVEGRVTLERPGDHVAVFRQIVYP